MAYEVCNTVILGILKVTLHVFIVHFLWLQKIQLTRKSLHISSASDDSFADTVSSNENSDDDFVPDSESCSEESEESLPRGKSRRLSQTSLSSPNVTLDSSDDYSSSMNAAQQSSSPEDKETSTQPVNDSSDVSVMKLKKTPYGQRVYNKKQYCFYCCKPFSKMTRHLAQMHMDEVEVAKALSFTRGLKKEGLI